MSKSLEAAAGYAAAGMPIFPVNQAKSPRTPHGLYDATRDLDQIRVWFGRWPDAGIGLPCGRSSGIAAIDLDADKGGLDAWEALTSEHGAVETVTQTTPRGGMHLLFAYPADLEVPCSVASIGPGIDVRGEDKGYILIAPSVGANGRAYTWVNPLGVTPLAPMPQWLLDAARATPPSRSVVTRACDVLSRRAPRPEFYVPLICGCEIDSAGFALCPNPAHGDTRPTLKVWRDSVTCFACQVKTRERGLAAMALGLGRKSSSGWALQLTAAERAQADALLVELGITPLQPRSTVR